MIINGGYSSDETWTTDDGETYGALPPMPQGIKPQDTPLYATHNFIDVINLHLRRSLEVILVLKNKSHESQFFWLR